MRSPRSRLEARSALGYQEILPNSGQIQGSPMTIDTSDGHKAMDYREHIRTYNGFLTGTIVLVVLVAIILLGMLIFLV